MKKDNDDLRELTIARAKELGLSAYAIAKATGIGCESVSRFLRRRTHMSSDNLSKIFRFLKIEIFLNQ